MCECAEQNNERSQSIDDVCVDCCTTYWLAISNRIMFGACIKHEQSIPLPLRPSLWLASQVSHRRHAGATPAATTWTSGQGRLMQCAILHWDHPKPGPGPDEWRKTLLCRMNTVEWGGFGENDVNHLKVRLTWEPSFLLKTFKFSSSCSA